MILRDWTEAEQARHRADLLAALDGYDGPKSGRPKLSDRQRRNLRHQGLDADLDHAPTVCPACLSGSHGQTCNGPRCSCRCRSMLGFNGPFPDSDWTAPTVEDQMGLIA